MNEVQNVTELARGISDYGFMVMASAVFLLLAAALMVACFRWFKDVIQNIMEDYSERLEKIQQIASKNTEAMVDIAEGLLPETQMRVKNTSTAYFDLAAYKVCDFIRKVRTENQIKNRPATEKKMRGLVQNLHDDRNSRFDNLRYRGRKLSEYTNPEWVEWVTEVALAELYNESGPNDERAATNVNSIYANIKIDFYKRIQEL